MIHIGKNKFFGFIPKTSRLSIDYSEFMKLIEIRTNKDGGIHE